MRHHSLADAVFKSFEVLFSIGSIEVLHRMKEFIHRCHWMEKEESCEVERASFEKCARRKFPKVESTSIIAALSIFRNLPIFRCFLLFWVLNFFHFCLLWQYCSWTSEKLFPLQVALLTTRTNTNNKLPSLHFVFKSFNHIKTFSSVEINPEAHSTHFNRCCKSRSLKRRNICFSRNFLNIGELSSSS